MMNENYHVAIVGRPNVGKSALFNRLIRKRLALVEGTPGVTRDRLEAPLEWNGARFILEDTGGLDLSIILSNAQHSGLQKEIQKQAQKALTDACLLIFVVDAKSGLTPEDKEIYLYLKKCGKPFLIAVNKADNEKLESDADEFYGLGVDSLFKVSALHGQGAGGLMDAIVLLLRALNNEKDERETRIPDEGGQAPLRIALLGRPNAGKSSLLNRIAGEDRVIVDAQPGTTRDSVDVHVKNAHSHFVFIDTPGIRKRKKVTENLEYYSVKRALSSVERADIVCLVLDSTLLVTAQDKKIAGYVMERGRGLIFVVNKWDLAQSVLQRRGRSIKGKEKVMKKEVLAAIKQQMNFFKDAPVLFASAKSGEGVENLLPLSKKVAAHLKIQIPDGELKEFLTETMRKHAPPSSLKIYSMKQAGAVPPAFVFHVNDKDAFHFSYSRFIENKLRDRFGFVGAPLRFIARDRGKEKS